jgi:hypothetical protein
MRKLRKEGFHNFFFLRYCDDQLYTDAKGGGGSRTQGKMINAHRVLVGKSEEKIPLERCK